MNRWSKKSKRLLDTCHMDIQILMNEVLKIQDCTIVEGARSEERQNELYEQGLSKVKYPNSKHNLTPDRSLSHAVDVVPYIRGAVSWDKEDILVFTGIVYAVWYKLYSTNVITHRIRLGMNWDTHPLGRDHKLNSFFDGAHIEIVEEKSIESSHR